MPVNDYGVRADIVIAPEAVVNRMNVGQLYEHFVNCVMDTVFRRTKELESYEDRFKMMLEFFYDIDKNYASAVERLHPTEVHRRALMKEFEKLGYFVTVVVPGLSTLTEDWVLYMRDKYNVHPTPVEYNLRDADGNLLRRVRTRRPIWIGKKYLYILYKIPHARSCGMSYVNQMGVPIRVKMKKSKSQHPVGLVPIRLGEDENRNLTMAVGPMAYRILSLYANSPDATAKLTEDLLTLDKPTRLDWVDVNEEQLSKSNTMIQVAKHMLETCGIDINDVLMTKEEERAMYNRIEQGRAAQ